MAYTKIEWTKAADGSLGRVWNPIRGCSIVSEGCRNCYAMRQAHRFSGKDRPYHGLTRMTPTGPKWTGKIRTVPELLTAPLHWRKPYRIFVNSMSDLFHESVAYDFVGGVYAIMARCPRHVFQILTKRPSRMRDFFEDHLPLPPPWVNLPNVWLGEYHDDAHR